MPKTPPTQLSCVMCGATHVRLHRRLPFAAKKYICTRCLDIERNAYMVRYNKEKFQHIKHHKKESQPATCTHCAKEVK